MTYIYLKGRRNLKKSIVLVSLILLFILSIFIYKSFNPQLKESDIIIEVNKNNIIKTSEESVLNFYEVNKEDLKKIANYLLANEILFKTRPVIINEQNSMDIEKITDESIKNLTNKLINEGTIEQVSSLNDNIKNVYFLLNSEYGIYEQGIRYVSDAKIITEDKTKYNYVKYYKDLGDGWFYYLFYYNEIKDAGIFRKKAWDTISENEKQSVAIDWNKAIVVLEDWNSVGYKKDNKERKFVVSVCFNTDVDGLLGPIIVYLDPSTKEVVGGGLRY